MLAYTQVGTLAFPVGSADFDDNRSASNPASRTLSRMSSRRSWLLLYATCIARKWVSVLPMDPAGSTSCGGISCCHCSGWIPGQTSAAEQQKLTGHLEELCNIRTCHFFLLHRHSVFMRSSVVRNLHT